MPMHTPYAAKPERYTTISYRRSGRSGLKLPAVSLGLWHNFGGVDRFETAREVVCTAFDCGITHFDLANNYGPPPGSAEETFGALLRSDAEAYRDSYDLILHWLQTYFDTQDARVAAFLSQLQALQTVEFNPYIPDLAGLNQAFREAIARRQPIRTLGKSPATAPAQPAASGGAQP